MKINEITTEVLADAKTFNVNLRKEIIVEIAKMINSMETFGTIGFDIDIKWESITEFTTTVAFILHLFKNWNQLFIDCDEKFVDLILKHFNEEQCKKLRDRMGNYKEKNFLHVFVIKYKSRVTDWGMRGYSTSLFEY